MRILADENIDPASVAGLRAADHDVHWAVKSIEERRTRIFWK